MTRARKFLARHGLETAGDWFALFLLLACTVAFTVVLADHLFR